MSLSGVRTFTFSQSDRSTLGGTVSKSRSSDKSENSGHTLESRSKERSVLSKAVAIDFQTVGANFQELKPYAKAQKNNLPRKILSKLLALLELAERIAQTEDYVKFMKIAEETFGDTSQEERGSVAHFFRAWSLEVSAEKGFDVACTADRAGVLPSPHDREIGHCSSYVGLLTDDGFTIHYAPPKHLDSLYIHTSKSSEDLGSRRDEVVAEMKKYNLTKYTLVYPNAEGTSTSGRTFFLPGSKGKDCDRKQASPAIAPAVKEDCDWSAWTIIIVLILVIFFLVAIALCFMTEEDYGHAGDRDYGCARDESRAPIYNTGVM